MASILRVNTLTDASSNNSIATSFVSGGSAKAWALLDLDNSTPANFDSLNLGSVTDNGTADMTQNFTSNMGNVNYSHAGFPMAQGSGVQGRTVSGHPDFPTTSAVRHQYGYPSSTGGNGQAYEDTQAYLIVHGDLA